MLARESGAVMEDQLTLEEQKVLLRLAREALEYGVRGQDLPPLSP